jgi:zinc-binding alcohol dehydrogenase family protein
MKAIGYYKSLPIADAQSLLDVDIPAPEPHGRDLRVSVRAISVNPVDTKMRMRSTPAEGSVAVLGWDVAGIVDATGPDATLFKPGDEVYYAGAIDRPGANAQLHLVDERIVGRKPKSLSFTEAAALPLTSITAWELLFDRLAVRPGKSPDNRTFLIVGGAGGVGSILIQLARRLTGLTVLATASRPETRQWCLDLGAHAVIDHSKPLRAQIEALGLPPVALVASLTNTDTHFEALADLIAPQGHLALIDDPATLAVSLLKRKSVALHWEFMYTRSLFQTADMIAQHNLLSDVSALVDDGVIKTTLGDDYGTINASNLKRAHAMLESGKARGKIVLTGWD